MNYQFPPGAIRVWGVKVAPEFMEDSSLTRHEETGMPGVQIVKGVNLFAACEGDELELSPTFRIATRKGAELESEELAQEFVKAADLVFKKRYKLASALPYLKITTGHYNPASKAGEDKIRAKIQKASDTARESIAKALKG